MLINVLELQTKQQLTESVDIVFRSKGRESNIYIYV